MAQIREVRRPYRLLPESGRAPPPGRGAMDGCHRRPAHRGRPSHRTSQGGERAGGARLFLPARPTNSCVYGCTAVVTLALLVHTAGLLPGGATPDEGTEALGRRVERALLAKLVRNPHWRKPRVLPENAEVGRPVGECADHADPRCSADCPSLMPERQPTNASRPYAHLPPSQPDRWDRLVERLALLSRRRGPRYR